MTFISIYIACTRQSNWPGCVCVIEIIYLITCIPSTDGHSGMLQNQDGMMLERIHAMLKMVAGGGAGGGGGSGCVRYDLSIVQLRKFLQSLITADTLEIVDGLYKLRK